MAVFQTAVGSSGPEMPSNTEIRRREGARNLPAKLLSCGDGDLKT